MYHSDDCPVCGEFIGMNPDCVECKRVIAEEQKEIRQQERKSLRRIGRKANDK
jgi:hypothetical protein